MSPGPLMVDVDGVLAEFVYGFRSLANKMWQVPVYLTPNQQTWAFDDLTAAQESAVWEAIRSSETFWQDLGALCPVKAWRRIAALCSSRDVYFVTSRIGPTAKRQTQLWLTRHGIKDPTVIVVGPKRKGLAAKLLQPSASIEDNAENATAISTDNPATVSYLLDRPYNRRLGPDGLDVVRIHDIGEFLDAVEA